jgi:hypothetical protein
MYQLKRLQRAGHVQRMEDTQIPKKVFKAKFGGVRSVGKPWKRWEDVCNRTLQISVLSQLEAGR